ncbi:DUF4233 domain-containing protein [Arthrobacter sulfonylureivorans]|uniref:DUF4233 domain-containing protein n=1 Tax=Arthrobacter sulfonylureivorans TaxID=2486855 RepID=UPI0039E6579D
MAKLTKAQREWRPNMPKKRRSIKTMFASTVLLLEAFVAFFATLVVFGLYRDVVSPALILGLGIGLSVVLVLCCALLRRPAGYAIGWVLQVLLILTGFVEPVMFVVGLLFALSWWYAVRTGGRLDRENAQRDVEQAEWEREHGGEAGAAGTAGAAGGDGR